jgi:hypothetical protein
MIIGDKSVFALECTISKTYELNDGFLALGCFLIHVNGHQFGVNDPSATYLACSVSNIATRIVARGTHTTTFAEAVAHDIVVSFRDAIYNEPEEGQTFLGISREDFTRLIYQNEIQWAPDGDAAFDDSSYVLHFDLGDRVRLIAFKSSEDGYYEPGTLTERILAADQFYGVLQDWLNAFSVRWDEIRNLGGE